MQINVNTDALSNLFQSIAKFAGRPPVQSQLLAAILTLLIAWYLSRIVIDLLGSWYNRWLIQRLPSAAQLAEPVVIEAGDGEKEAKATTPAPARLPRSVRFVRPIARVVRLLIYPSLSLVLVGGVIWLFGQLGWVTGLLESIQRLLLLFLAYRLLVGVLYDLFDERRVRHLHHRVLAPAFWLAIFLLALQRLANLNTLAGMQIVTSFANSITVGQFFVATVGLYFWITITGSMQEFLQALFTNHLKFNAGAVEAGLILWRYGTVALGIYFVLRLLNFDVTTVAFITGGLSIGVGLALQDVLKNFIGGIILLFEGSVRPGDWVEIGGSEGEVQKLNVRSTVVRTSDNVELIVPNQNWLNSTVTSYTRTNRRVRTRLAIGVRLNSDIQQVMKILVETARNHPQVLADPAPSASLVEFGASSINFLLLVWVDDAVFKGRVVSELRLLVWDALAANHIDPPFPQQEIYLHNSIHGI